VAALARKHPTRPLDGVHARRCANTGRATTRHHAVRDAVFDLLRGGARIMGVLKESRAPFVLGTEPTRRMDIVVPSGSVVLPPTTHEPEGGGRARLASM